MAKKDQRQKNSKKKRNLKIAIIAWLVLALTIFVFFMLERKTIVSNLQDFFGKVFVTRSTGQQASSQQNVDVPPQIELTTPENVTEAVTITQAEIQNTVTATPTENSQATGDVAADKSTSQSGASENATQSSSASAAGTSTPATNANAAAQTQRLSRAELCFVVIDSGDGSVSRKVVTRDLPRSDAPLTAALNALLGGPTPAEKSLNCSTLIPSGTRLLGATVRDGVAYLNFSENFEINNVGVEGYTAQMMQIVYTATSFSTVSSVQFLIEGERKEYLGSEGLWIGSPLNRASFR